MSIDPSDAPVIPWNLEFRQAQAVVIGTVLSERNLYEAESPNWPSGTLYKLKREAVLKGRLSEYIQVFSPNDSGRVPLAKGTRYILFLSRRDGRFIADGCGNSAKLVSLFQ